MAKRALITGVTGQDGSYLAELLLENGYEVFGVIRRLSASNSWRIDHLGERITLLQADLLDQLSLIKAVERADPHEFYNLAAMSFDPACQSEDPLLPGFLERDVRPRPRGSANRKYTVLSAESVRGLEGVWPLHH